MQNSLLVALIYYYYLDLRLEQYIDELNFRLFSLFSLANESKSKSKSKNENKLYLYLYFITINFSISMSNQR
jgi:hypothetical protein